MQNTSAELSVWLFFQIAANHIALPMLVATFLLSKTASRHFTIINACLTWVVSGIVSTLLFYVGQHVGPEPRKDLCIAQASLIGAVLPMTSAALLCLVYFLWSTVDVNDPRSRVKTRKRMAINAALLSLPYLVFGLFVAIGVNLALQHSDRVNRERRYFYCSLDWNPFTQAAAILSSIICITSVAFEIHLAYLISHNWTSIHRQSRTSKMDLDLITRVVLFTFYMLTANIFNLVSIWAPVTVPSDMLFASVGMVLFLVLVSHRNVINAWRFCGRIKSRSSSRSTLSSDPSPSLQLPALGFRTSDEASLDTARSLREYYEAKASGKGVQIIGKPEEAFVQDRQRRSTIATWGF